MNSPGGSSNRQRRGVKPRTARNAKATHEKPSGESVSGVSASDERQTIRRCHNRTGLSRRRKGWSSPSDSGGTNYFVKPWSLRDGLRRWKETGKYHCRYFYGNGCGQVLLERDIEEGIWKVMTVPGCRFSPLWLDTILQWATEFQTAQLELNKEPADATDSSGSRSRTNQLEPSALSTREETSLKPSTTDPNCTGDQQSQDQNDRRDRRSRRQERVIQYSRSGAVHRARSFFTGKICISLRCERMGLTDVEMDMISKWQRQNSSVLSIVKLWLFDNKITDSGARHISQLVNDELLEIHVSHNSMTNSGAQQIMMAATSTRKASSKPFWLRMEWNMINHDELKIFISEMEKEKGMVVDIPRFHLRRSRGKASSCLINERKVAHLRLPWIQCQRLRPSEAPVLMQAKSSWQENRNNHLKQNVKPASDLNNCMDPPSSSPSFRPKKPNSQNACGQSCSSGPLLVFPDTSALLGLIGCKVKTGSTPFLSFDWLDGLCQKGNFGRCLPPNERVFFVLCDSVMKQLDGLKKHSAHVGLCVRKLVNSGLEKYGPAGQDFLTILGAHEGEGIIVDRNAEVLDSRSHHVFNKGQAIDLKIVEVALFFQQELCLAASQFRQSAEESQILGQLPNPNHPFCFPVVLFSNDNVQLMAAKSHGLPAFRYTDLQKCTHSREVMHGRKPLTASVLRSLIGKKATVGLGARARKSLQDEFDGIVACMKHLMESYEDAKNLLGQTKEILEGNSKDALTQLKQLLDIGQQNDAERRKSDKSLAKGHIDSESSSIDNVSEETEDDSLFGICLEDGVDDPSPATSAEMDEPKTSDSSAENSSKCDEDEASDGETIPLVRAKLAEWECLVKSYQHPSRILRWTSGHLYSD